jgi:hypothetical protein
VTSQPICHYVSPDGEGDWDADCTLIVARCGATCILDPDGKPLPADFDFVLAPDPRELTDCWGCLSKLSEPAAQRSARRLEPA